MDTIEQVAHWIAMVIGFLAVWFVIGELIMNYYMPQVDWPTTLGSGIVDEKLHGWGIFSSFILTVLLYGGLMYFSSQ